MARPLRIESEVPVYHITSRDDALQQIFLDDADRASSSGTSRAAPFAGKQLRLDPHACRESISLWPTRPSTARDVHPPEDQSQGSQPRLISRDARLLLLATQQASEALRHLGNPLQIPGASSQEAVNLPRQRTRQLLLQELGDGCDDLLRGVVFQSELLLEQFHQLVHGTPPVGLVDRASHGTRAREQCLRGVARRQIAFPIMAQPLYLNLSLVPTQ